MFRLPHSEPTNKIPMPSREWDAVRTREQHRKIASTLLLRCRSECLSVTEAKLVLELAIQQINEAAKMNKNPCSDALGISIFYANDKVAEVGIGFSLSPAAWKEFENSSLRQELEAFVEIHQPAE